jgi:hypothetical protein
LIVADRWPTQTGHIVTGQSGAFSEDFCTALLIDQKIAIVLREASQDMPNQVTFRPTQWSTVKNPVSFTESHQQTRIAQDFQVSRNSRLALRNHAGNFADRQLALRADSQQSEPGWFGGSFESGKQCRAGQEFTHSGLLRAFVFIYIKTSLCAYANYRPPP